MGIQGDEQYEEKGQQMKSADGSLKPDEAQGRTKEPAGRVAVVEIDEVAADGTAADGTAGEPGTKGAEGAPKVSKTDLEKPSAAAEGAPSAGAAQAVDEGAKDRPGGADSGTGAGFGAEEAAAYGVGEQPQDEGDVLAAGAEPHISKGAGGTAASGVGQGAGAVIAAGLGIVSLTGSWLGTVAGARESLVGQLQTTQGASVAKQIQEVYGDQWHVTALVGGAFALLALVIGVVVLARPAFGAPGHSQAPWIKSVSWAGVALGVIGLLLAVLKYSDAILGLPTVQS